METVVLIVGSGPSGLAAAACLGVASVPYLLLEREDCVAPLWRKRTYDCLHLHLIKRLCELPHMPYPPGAPTFVPRDDVVCYLDAYASRFGVRPLFGRQVEAARYDAAAGRWRLTTRSAVSGEAEEYASRYLVVASGENDRPFVPRVPGLETFPAGRAVHSSEYRSAEAYRGKAVLVVGSGNSGMEIACDLCRSGARVSIVIRSPLHLVTREILHFGILLSKIAPCAVVDAVVVFLCNLKFGDMSKHGIRRPKEGPFYLKANTPAYPVMDTGTAAKIRSGEIQVLPSIKNMEGNNVTLEDGRQQPFDAIIFATGYRSDIKRWLKDDEDLIGDDGMAKNKFPNHWKGRRGLYCAGLLRKGFYGSAADAQSIADDIAADLLQRRKKASHA